MNNVIKTEYKQRAYDGKWQLLGLIMDKDNAYEVSNSEGNKITLIPEKWITLNVYDYELEIVDE